jgi:hypothetical protein
LAISDLASRAGYAPTMSTEGTKFARPADSSAARGASSLMARQWAAVQEAAGAVAMLAGLAPEKPGPRERNFIAQVQALGGARLKLAENHVADIAAFMQPGLAALLAVNARGQDATAPALALWREFWCAREALLALAPDPGAMGPPRSA